MGDEGYARWLAKAMRHSVSPAAALEGFDVWYATDVRGILGSVQTPTLVMVTESYSASGDAIAMTKYMAERIPGARLLTLPGADLFPYGDDSVRVIEAISEFVGSHRAEQADFERVVGHCPFHGHRLLRRSERPRWATIRGRSYWSDTTRWYGPCSGRYRGVEVTTAGDGFFATFDGPARAVRCAQAIVAAVRPLGIEVRAGVHTGEIEYMGDNVGGMAVHIGARVGRSPRPAKCCIEHRARPGGRLRPYIRRTRPTRTQGCAGYLASVPDGYRISGHSCWRNQPQTSPSPVRIL